MSRLADAARAYIGTRFRHRGRSRQSIDCAGLVVMAYADCGVVLPDFQLYMREPFKDQLTKKIIEALGEPVIENPKTLAVLRDGDVIEIRYDSAPHHVAIVGERIYDGKPRKTMIHADAWAPPAVGASKPGQVHEHILPPSLLPQITRVFRRPV